MEISIPQLNPSSFKGPSGDLAGPFMFPNCLCLELPKIGCVIWRVSEDTFQAG